MTEDDGPVDGHRMEWWHGGYTPGKGWLAGDMVKRYVGNNYMMATWTPSCRFLRLLLRLILLFNWESAQGILSEIDRTMLIAPIILSFRIITAFALNLLHTYLTVQFHADSLERSWMPSPMRRKRTGIQNMLFLIWDKIWLPLPPKWSFRTENIVPNCNGIYLPIRKTITY